MDELRIEKKPNLGFIPEIIGYLANIEDHDYIYTEYKIRHPGAVFNIVTHYLVEDFIDLLKELEVCQAAYDEKREINLERKLRILILDFLKYQDSCYEIIMGCCKQHEPPKKGAFYKDWLNSRNHKYFAAENLNTHMKALDELDQIRKINNRLKHTSFVLRPSIFLSQDSIIHGFYVEGAIAVRGVGPDDEIHPKYDGNTRSANSYNFILMNLYYILYKISDILKKVIIQHYTDVFSLNIAFNDAHIENDKNWKELNDRITKLPNDYFPNEFGKITYKIQNTDSQLIFNKKPAEPKDLDGSFLGKFNGDGFSRTYGIPYMSPETNR